MSDRDTFGDALERVQREDRERRRNHACSLLANAEERIGILIDEDEPDEAKEEIAALCAAMRRWLETAA